MTQKDIDERLEEYRRIRPNPGFDAVALAEAALFIEDVFGICLPDEEISGEHLGTFERIRALLYEKLKGI